MSKVPSRKSPPPKLKSVSYYKKRADKAFSLFIRRRDNFTCFTCDLVGNNRNIQCGHFIPRQYGWTRYDERNNNAQCYACNMLYNGQAAEYALRLQKKYGDGIIQELNSRRKEEKRFTPQELKAIEEKYTEKLKTLI